MAGCVPQEAESWIARNEAGSRAGAETARRQVEEQICQSVRGHLASVCQRPAAVEAAAFDTHARRVWVALEYHWKRLAQAEPLPFSRLLARAEAAELGVGTGKASLVYEVVLAQALEFRDNRAAELFHVNYLPSAVSTARRVAGERGAELVENFGADLVMPRDGRPPKIAQFQGRTFLTQWLRSVVTNHCLSAMRKYQPDGLEHDPAGRQPAASLEIVLDRVECKQLLQPILQSALSVLTADDCLLIKLLTLDGVPQGQVARSLGIHSGNVGRQRDKIAQGILKRLWDSARGRSREAHFQDCFYSLLSGEDPVLRDWIGQELAGAFASDTRGQVEHDG